MHRLIPYFLFIAFMVLSINSGAFAKGPETSGKPATISESREEDLSKYIKTHVELICSIAAPYVEEYANINNIDIAGIEKKLFPFGLYLRHDPILGGLYINSKPLANGTASAYRSNSTVIYELRKITVHDDPIPYALVLYNKRTPVEVTEDENPEWNLALIRIPPPLTKDESGRFMDYALLSDISFKTKMKYGGELAWDVIVTGLKLENNVVIVTIEYTHWALSEERAEEFTYRFSVMENPVKIKLTNFNKTEEYEWYREEE